MFARRYFAGRYFAPRYFPGVGATVIVPPTPPVVAAAGPVFVYGLSRRRRARLPLPIPRAPRWPPATIHAQPVAYEYVMSGGFQYGGSAEVLFVAAPPAVEETVGERALPPVVLPGANPAAWQPRGNSRRAR